MRSLACLVALVCLLPAAPASAVSTNAPTAPSAGKAKAFKAPSRDATRDKQASPEADFVITATSEVRLNGRSCRFKDVPGNAVITAIQVDADTREVIKVHFTTGK